MHRRLIGSIGIAASLMLVPAPAQAATITFAGVFLDHNGKPVPGAGVSITHPASGNQQITWTDSAGGFLITATRGESLVVSADSNVANPPGPYQTRGPYASGSGVARPGTLYVVEDLPVLVTPTIVGTEGDDVITGTSGKDVVFAGAGNDTITGLDGEDIILGGEGDDTIDGGSGGETILAGAGNDTVNGGPGADVILGEEGADVLRGDGGDDQITDHNYDSQAINRLIGGAGDDYIFMGTNAWGEAVPASYLIGGAGNDRIYAPGSAIIRAGAGDDVIQGVLRGGKTYCGDGNDIAYPNSPAQSSDFYDACEQVVTMA